MKQKLKMRSTEYKLKPKETNKQDCKRPITQKQAYLGEYFI